MSLYKSNTEAKQRTIPRLLASVTGWSLRLESPAYHRGSSTSPSIINWDRVPKRIQAVLERGERLPTTLRSEFVRWIIDDIHEDRKPYPRTAQLRVVANQVVAKYAKSLKDTIDGDKIGTGYDSLLAQLVNRVDNLSRPLGMKRPNMDSTRGSTQPKKMTTTVADSYGCVRWQVALSTDALQKQKATKEKLKDMFNTSSEQPDEDVKEEVRKDMMSVYAAVRQDINNGKDVKELSLEWPYLFKVPYLFNHFEHLMDFDIISRMTTNIGARVPKIIRYLDANAKLADTLKDIKHAIEIKEDDTPQIIGLVLLLGDYFGEKDAIVFPKNKDVETTVTDIPAYPCLITHGKPVTATVFTLVVENSVMTEVTNPISALAAWFAVYYIVNLRYPEGHSNVLEFIQRAILGINPERGCKRTKTKGKKPAISPAVLKLTTALANFENEFVLS